jgi:ubiquinone biosynthesis protein
MLPEERPEQIRQAVARGLKQWRQANSTAANGRGPILPAADELEQLFTVDDDAGRLLSHEVGANGRDAAPHVLQEMPRRPQMVDPTAAAETADVATPTFHKVTFKAGFWRSVGRLLMWLYLIVYVLGGNLWDKPRKQDSLERQAARLRQGLEKVGGTFVKLGQQVAMRIDLVPWEYCLELSKMLDKMPPFPLEEALAIIERTTGQPWRQTFAVFDPEPVGSASVACVYQALLKDGTKVAVKVRRPGIGELFATDFRVLDWLSDLIEFLTIVRPGFTRNLRREFQETLLEELDFTKEARFQDIFRRRARKKKGKKFFTAPKVFFELSGEEVIVQEFVSGMWLWEVIAAIEQNDTYGQTMMRQLNIEPGLVARRILWINFWADENLFFHADPHPANILVRRNSQLTFVDFGSCGSFNVEQRIILERIVLAMQKNDAEGMARTTLKLLEPFPPIDVETFIKEAETEFMRVIHTFRTKAKHTEWWERTSARLWLTMVNISQKHNIPLNLHTLRMIRATLLYDTLALRLDSTVDRYKEYNKFIDYRARLAKERWQHYWQREAVDDFFLRVEEIAEAGDDLLLRLHHTLSSPIVNFGSAVDKWVFMVTVIGRTVGRIALITVLALLLVVAGQYLGDDPVSLTRALYTAVGHGLYQFIIATIIILNVRHILFRLRESEHDG